MVSVVITAKQEAHLIQRAIRAFLDEDFLGEKYELIVVAPDEATLSLARALGADINLLRDKGVSKAAAMKLAAAYVHGEKIIFSDGDVVIQPGAVKELLKAEADAVGGHPVYQNYQAERQPYKYWQECLVDMAHKLRLAAMREKRPVLLSGYLLLIKAEILKQIELPDDLLAEDSFLSYWLWQHNYKTTYAPQAKVLVKYPNNYSDWLKQKVRTLAGAYQLPRAWRQAEKRNFNYELKGARQMWADYVNNWRQAVWMGCLFIARLHAWWLAYLKFKVFKQTQQQIWQRVESSK